jgi:hypothetical protein
MTGKRKADPMIEYDGRTVAKLRLIGAGKRYSGFRLTDSTFTGCVLAQYDDPELTLEVHDASVERCRVERCSTQGVYFDEITVDTLRFAQMHNFNGCVFRHVTLRGKITGTVMAAGPRDRLPNRPDLVAGIVRRYKDVDWALDISEAVFTDADFYYVPGELIRRDESSQFLLLRERFADVDWRELPGFASIWASRFDATPFDSLVAIAPKASKRLPEYMADAEWLRNQGLID